MPLKEDPFLYSDNIESKLSLTILHDFICDLNDKEFLVDKLQNSHTVISFINFDINYFIFSNIIYIKKYNPPMKKKYESTKNFRDKYNKVNSTVQLNRELLNKLKSYLEDKNMSMKDYLEGLIKESIE